MGHMGLMGLIGLIGLIGLMGLVGLIGHIGLITLITPLAFSCPYPLTVYCSHHWGFGCFYILALPYTFLLLYRPVLKTLFCLFLLVLGALCGLGE